jgi:hypothetical protein
VTAALDFLYPADTAPAQAVGGDIRPALRVVPAEHIPLQSAPALTISLTEGCDAPLDALRAAPDRAVACHPCDEAIVTLLLLRVRRFEGPILTSAEIKPGTLRLA